MICRTILCRCHNQLRERPTRQHRPALRSSLQDARNHPRSRSLLMVEWILKNLREWMAEEPERNENIALTEPGHSSHSPSNPSKYVTFDELAEQLLRAIMTGSG